MEISEFNTNVSEYMPYIHYNHCETVVLYTTVYVQLELFTSYSILYVHWPITFWMVFLS